jgi:hypothetical protein
MAADLKENHILRKEVVLMGCAVKLQRSARFEKTKVNRADYIEGCIGMIYKNPLDLNLNPSSSSLRKCLSCHRYDRILCLQASCSATDCPDRVPASIRVAEKHTPRKRQPDTCTRESLP